MGGFYNLRRETWHGPLPIFSVRKQYGGGEAACRDFAQFLCVFWPEVKNKLQ
jgi:hypothetical protein